MQTHCSFFVNQAQSAYQSGLVSNLVVAGYTWTFFGFIIVIHVLPGMLLHARASREKSLLQEKAKEKKRSKKKTAPK